MSDIRTGDFGSWSWAEILEWGHALLDGGITPDKLLDEAGGRWGQFTARRLCADRPKAKLLSEFFSQRGDWRVRDD